MDLMKRRREIIAQGGKIDTSPKIASMGYKLSTGQLVADSSCAVTVIYDVVPSRRTQKMTGGGLTAQIAVYKDGVYVDYWPSSSMSINANANGVAATILIPTMDDAYLYINDTGVILFAGKNSIYYGYANINDMPT